jgi:hypothetical protein
MIDNDGDAVEDVTFQFRFRTEARNPNTFLYNTGPVTSLDSANWNVRQFYTITRIDGPRHSGRATIIATDLPTPPVNVGLRSTPNYEALAAAAVQQLPNNSQVFAGQRDDPFYVDLNVFDAGCRDRRRARRTRFTRRPMRVRAAATSWPISPSASRTSCRMGSTTCCSCSDCFC